MPVGIGPITVDEGQVATAGTIVLESKIATDIVLTEDGKYYVDAITSKCGDTIQEWTEGPFDTETKARETLKWQVALPVNEKVVGLVGPQKGEGTPSTD